MRRLGLALVLLGCWVATPHAAARTPLVVGIADQRPQMFSDPLFTSLGITHARYVVPWDAMDGGFQRDELFAWMRAARADGVVPLLSFGHSRIAGRQKLRPSPTELQHQFRRMRVNFPWATEWGTWNEPNHCSQPLCHRPELAARYFDALTRACATCTILGAEVLDQPNMAGWVRRFRRVARHEPTAWGLHNYLDANRLRTSGTRALLGATKGEIWFTETGGIVRRTAKVKIPFEESTRHAAVATRWVFDRLAPLSSRISRVYLYHWNSGSPVDSWDSGLVDRHGRARPAYAVLRARVLRSAAEHAAG